MNTELEDSILDDVLTELKNRGVLTDEWEEVFGCKSFDEVAAVIRRYLDD